MNKLFQSFMLTVLVVFFVSCNKDDDNQDPEPQKSNIQEYVTVTRSADGGFRAASNSCTLNFSKTGTWKVYQGTTPGSIDMSVTVAETSEASVNITALDAHQRYYFEVVLDGKEKATVASTGVAIKGQKNFRDLGGFVTEDGKSVKWGMVFRSGELKALTDDDRQFMTSMQFDKLIDFRFAEEIAEAPDNIPEGIEVLNIPVEQGSYSRDQMTMWLMTNDHEAFDTLLIHANKVFVTDAQVEFGNFLKELESGKRIVFHCTAGKDRTGYATALFLSALGVDRETIMEDYLSSNDYNTNYIEQTIEYVNSLGLNGELLRPVMVVKSEYLEQAFSTIDNQYGGMDSYLDLLGVDREKLKSLYLE